MKRLFPALAALALAGCQSGAPAGNAANPANDAEPANGALPATAAASAAAPAAAPTPPAPAPAATLHMIDLKDATGFQVAEKLALLADKPAMAPGLWETSLTRELVSVKGLTPEAERGLRAQATKTPTRSSDCVADRKVILPQVSDLGQFGRDCRFARYHVAAGRFEVRASCTSPARTPISLVMSGSYAADNVSLDLDVTLALPNPQGATIRTKAHSKTRRLGECAPGTGPLPAAKP